MKITLHRNDFIEIKDYYNGQYQTLNTFDLMLKSQFNINDTDDIDSIDVDIDTDTIKTF